MSKILCDVFKTKKKDEMYLYVTRKDAFTRVPEELMTMFGKPELAMTMILTPEKIAWPSGYRKSVSSARRKGVLLANATGKRTLLTRSILQN